ncbi:MAG: hypothetical protein CL874_00440 [Dehalococcoidales bacterium]|jgi:TRAP-type C4-dicarboxylate transport system substrate-binding protein|nr:hypothetical protein [Dehalococcoidales bacterium]MDP6576634.1 TRAP transporter substrate-binding protein DctP [Dehalococcoidales bacterium]
MWQIRGAIGTSDMNKRHWDKAWGYIETTDRIREKSGGRLDIRVMTPAEAGIKGPEALRALGDNLVEVAQIGSIDEKWMDVVQLPFLCDDPYLDSVKLAEVLAPYTDEVGVKYDVTWIDHSRAHPRKWIAVYTKDRVETLDDLKGLKLRIYTPYHQGVLEKAGATPVFIPFAEVAMALKTGVIDGLTTSQGLAIQQHYDEADIKYQQAMWAFSGVQNIGVSNKALDSLPVDLKKIFLEGWQWYRDMIAAHAYNDLFFQEIIANDLAGGQTILDINPEFSRVLERYSRKTDWVNYTEENGAKGAEILNKALQAMGKPLM